MGKEQDILHSDITFRTTFPQFGQNHCQRISEWAAAKVKSNWFLEWQADGWEIGHAGTPGDVLKSHPQWHAIPGEEKEIPFRKIVFQKISVFHMTIGWSLVWAWINILSRELIRLQQSSTIHESSLRKLTSKTKCFLHPSLLNSWQYLRLPKTAGGKKKALEIN